MSKFKDFIKYIVHCYILIIPLIIIFLCFALFWVPYVLIFVKHNLLFLLLYLFAPIPVGIAKWMYEIVNDEFDK